MKKVSRNEKSCLKYEKLPKNVAEQLVERPSHVRILKIYRRWAIVLGKSLGKMSRGGVLQEFLGGDVPLEPWKPLAYTRAGSAVFCYPTLA